MGVKIFFCSTYCDEYGELSEFIQPNKAFVVTSDEFSKRFYWIHFLKHNVASNQASKACQNCGKFPQLWKIWSH